MNLAPWRRTKSERNRWQPLLLAVGLVLLMFLALSWHSPALQIGNGTSSLLDPGAPAAFLSGSDSVSPPTLRRQTPAAAAVLASAFAIGFVALLLALTQRTLPDAGLAAACALWAAHTGLAAAQSLEAPGPQAALLVILIGFAGLVGWYVMRLLQLPPRRRPLGFIALTLLPLLIGALGSSGLIDRHGAQVLALLGLLAAGLVLLARVLGPAAPGSQRDARRQLVIWLVGLALTAALSCGAQELAMLARHGLLQGGGPDGTLVAGNWVVSRWLVLILLGVLTGVRIDQVAHTMQQLEQDQRSSRSRTREVQRSLRATQARLDSRERVEIQRQQRDRLLREVHDTVSRRLTKAIHLARQEQDAARLQHLLDISLMDLSLALSALESGPTALPDALRELRCRVEPMLHAQGVQLDWELGPGIEDLDLSGNQMLQILRITQEALMRVLQHAAHLRNAALSLDLHSDARGRWLRLSVRDDRRGVPVRPEEGSVSGWDMLQHQSDSLGATLLVGPQAEGWTVELKLPLRGH